MNNERTVYVIYVPELGFAAGKSSSTISHRSCFSKARVFTGINHAKNSVLYRRALNDGKSPHIIPVAMTLDPEQLFEVLIRG